MNRCLIVLFVLASAIALVFSAAQAVVPLTSTDLRACTGAACDEECIQCGGTPCTGPVDVVPDVENCMVYYVDQEPLPPAQFCTNPNTEKCGVVTIWGPSNNDICDHRDGEDCDLEMGWCLRKQWYFCTQMLFPAKICQCTIGTPAQVVENGDREYCM